VGRVVGAVGIVVLAAVSVAGALVARTAALEPPVHQEVLSEAAEWALPSRARARRTGPRDTLFAEVQPVKLLNCELTRLGEGNDGGYLVCGNLLNGVGSAYSYGISGYDGWGCDVSTRLKVPVHQYDCFNTTRPSCPTGQPVFHPECIAGTASTDADGRRFDSLQSQITRNGDAGKHLIVKMDVEGAEWDSILQTPDEVLDQVDQFIFEFHGIDRDADRYLKVIHKLKRLFVVAHLHFNNYACVVRAAPFPAWAYEVTYVNRRLAQVDPAGGKVTLPSPLDAPNMPLIPDCQTLPLLQ
jgi:hypothetical protein